MGAGGGEETTHKSKTTHGHCPKEGFSVVGAQERGPTSSRRPWVVTAAVGSLVAGEAGRASIFVLTGPLVSPESFGKLLHLLELRFLISDSAPLFLAICEGLSSFHIKSIISVVLPSSFVCVR